MGATKVRKSVPLTQADAAGLDCLREDVNWRSAALELAGVELSEKPSEAEALHALLTVGRWAIELRATEKAMATGYAALAESMNDEDRQISKAAGRRTARLAD